MNIVVLSGSPRKGANTDIMVDAFVETARDGGHTVEVIRVAGKKIAGCLGCKYCFAHEGACVQKDDMADVLEALKRADMVVFASPIYWFDITAQEKAAIDRLYAFGATGFPFTKTALLLDGHSEGVYDAPIGRSDFGRGLLRGLFLRPACHACPYVTADRPGDLTLGLFHGLPKDFYPEEQKRGVSLLLVNSPKGAHVFDTLPLKRELRTLDEAVAGNPALRSVTCIPAERSAFFEAFVHQPFHQVQHRFLAASRPRVAPAKKAGSKRGLLQRLLRRKEK